MSSSKEQNACLIIDKLNHQKETGCFCDVEIVFQNEVFNAHRNVLAAHSEYFLSVFKKNSIIKERLTIDGCKNVNAFRSLISYMYTGVIVVKWETIAELLRLSREFKMETVTNYCDLYMRGNTNDSNCYTVHCLAEKYNLSELYEEVFDFIKHNETQVLEGKELLNLSPKKLKTFLKKFSDLPPLNLLHFLSKWVEHDINRRENCLHDMLEFIDWPQMNISMFEEDVMRGLLFKNNTNCLTDLLNHAKTKQIKLKGSYHHTLTPLNNVNSNTVTDSQSFINDDSTAISKSYEDKLVVSTANVKRSRKAKSPQKAIVTSSEDSGSEFDVSYAVEKQSSFNSENEYCNDPKPSYSAKKKRVQQISPEEDKNRCRRCSFKWADISDYNKHLKTHFKRQPFRCHDCKFKTMKINLLSRHFIKHTNESIYKCLTCNSRCKSQQELLRHLKNEHDIQGIISSNRTRLIKSVQSKYKLKCDKCPFFTSSKMKLKGHILYVHESDKTYNCRECDFTWKWHLDYDQHLKTHYPGPPYHCKECDFVGTQIRKLSRHLCKHDTDRPFKCSMCTKSFKSLRDVKGHQKNVHTKDIPNNISPSELGYKPKQLRGTAKCDKCSFASHSLELLQAHVKSVHETDATYTCPDCDFKWTWIRDYTAHLRTHYTTMPFKCKECNYSTFAVMNFAYHLFRHSDKRQFTCSQCGESFRSLQRYKVHKKDCGIDVTEKAKPVESRALDSSVLKRKFKCLKCAFSGDSEERLKNHMTVFHAEDTVHKCQVCDFLWENPSTYYVHFKKHFEGPAYKCKECNFRTKRIHSLSRHMYMHGDDRPFKCGICSFTFKSPLNLQDHVREKHPVETFPCDKCRMTFPSKKRLSNHQLNHINPTAFLCDICGWHSKSRSNLNSHRVIHNKVHQCDYPGCSYKTAHKRLILSHTLRHKGEFPYICSSCGKRFSDPTVLRSHEVHKCGKIPVRPRKKKVATIENEFGNNSTIPYFQSDSANNADDYQAVDESLSSNTASLDNIGSRECVNYMMPIAPPSMLSTEYFPVVNPPVIALDGSSLNVPTISRELPTEIRSFMTFM